MKHLLKFCMGFVALFGVAAARGQIVTGGGATGTSLTVSTLNTGTTLAVSGAVSGDGRYVTLDIDPQLSILDGIDTFTVGSNGATVGGMNVPGGNGIVRAFAMRRVPYRAAQIGNVVCVDHDKKMLATRMPAMPLKQMSLRAAVTAVADATHQNIVLGLRGLKEAGINVDAPHDFNIGAGTIKEALLSILQTAAGDTDLVMTAEDKVISIATQAQADNMVVTKSYYLADLLANAPRWMAGGTDVESLGRGAAKFGIGAKPLDFTKPPDPDAPEYDPADGYNSPRSEKSAKAASPQAGEKNARTPPGPTNIVELITSTVRPEIWKVNGGKVGEIGASGNLVVIRAPQSVHALLEGPKHYNPNRVPLYVGYGQ